MTRSTEAIVCRAPLLTLALIAVAPAPQAARTPYIAHFTLKNGLEVVVIPDHRAPVVTHMIWYKVGSADETPGKSGLAHFLEHLMFKGTAQIPEASFSQVAADMGGQENAFTTGLHRLFPADPREHLLVMDFEADRMTGLVLTDDVPSSRARCCARGVQSCGSRNSPTPGWPSSWTRRCISTHPYGRPVIGWHPRDREAEPGRRARLLSAFLHTEQCHFGDRRRRDRRRAVKASPSRPMARWRALRAWPALAAAGAAAGAVRNLTLADHRVEQPLFSATTGAVALDGQARREPGTGSARPRARRRRDQPDLSDLVVTSRSPSMSARSTSTRRSMRRGLACTARRARGLILPARAGHGRGARRARREGGPA